MKRNDTWSTISSRFGNPGGVLGLYRANPNIRLLSQGISLRVPQQQQSGAGGWAQTFLSGLGWAARNIAPLFGNIRPPQNVYGPMGQGWGGPQIGRWNYGGRVQPSAWSRPTPGGTPRPPAQQSAPGGMPPYQPGQGPWLPPQAYLRPNQYTGTPYTAPRPPGAPAPRTPGAAPATQSNFSAGGVHDQMFPWLDVYGRPGIGAMASPASQYGIFAPPAEQSSGGGWGGGGWGWGGGKGGKLPKEKKAGTISLLPDQSYPWGGGGYSPTGRAVDVNNAAMGFIHWRV